MNIKKVISYIVASAILLSNGSTVITNELKTSAASVLYPVQYFRLGMSDTDTNVNAFGTDLKPAYQNGTNAEKWFLNWVSSGIFEIVSADSGKILTANGSSVDLENDTDNANQRWKIEGVQKDFDGYYLYYKITSNTDSSKVLTFSENSGFSLASYSSSNTYQKYKLNLDGCEGWAANANTSSGEKACTIGGLLGETVFVSSADDLEKQLKTTEPKTIVLTSDIDMKDKSHTRIKDNKTLVGCYGSHTIYDSHFRTNNEYGTEGDNPSDNIIIRNLKMVAKNKSNRILINIWSSRQIWIDHIYFESQLSYDRKGNGQDEVGKFIWINTPYMTYMDKKDNGRSPDYVTISYCHLKNRYWTVAYGTQNTEITRNRTTVLYNWWDENVRRCPQIGNGSAHIFNNYYSAYGKDNNGSATSGIIGGDGSNVVSENNMFNGYTISQAFMTGNDPNIDNNSYLSEILNGTPSIINYKPKKVSTWCPNKTNYGYSLLPAWNGGKIDVKDFCTKYAGDAISASSMQYITNSIFENYVQTKYENPFLRHVDITTATAESFVSGSTYKIKNVNSNLYMQVDGAKAENGANVQQWGTSDNVTHDIWKLIDVGDGYYSIISAVGDGGTYALDVAGKKNADGTNIDIYKYNNGDNQKFMFTKNSDGSYKIRTKISNEKSAVEIKNALKTSGANVQQWTINGESCQDWILEPVSDAGCSMNTTVIYEFENKNSGMVMDIESGKMEENANVQQWATSHFNSQKWILQSFGSGNYYYIRSYADQRYCLKAMSNSNGGNIAIVPYSTKDSSMLFRFSKNPDGSYSIITHASNDNCFVEVANASSSNGANIQQWNLNGHNCQKWNAVTETTTTINTTTTTTTTITATTTIANTTTTSEADKYLKGDVNADGEFNIADVIILQKWLLAVPDTELANWKAADLCEDGTLNVFDLCMMKRELISK